jgi:hypothetical protein
MRPPISSRPADVANDAFSKYESAERMRASTPPGSVSYRLYTSLMEDAIAMMKSPQYKGARPDWLEEELLSNPLSIGQAEQARQKRMSDRGNEWESLRGGIKTASEAAAHRRMRMKFGLEF